MYQKPALQRYGSLRALTLIGTGADGDGGLPGPGWLTAATDGCNLIPVGDCGRS